MIYTEISGTGKRRGREMGNESEKEVRKAETRWGGKGRNKKLWTLDTDTDHKGKHQQGRGVRAWKYNIPFSCARVILQSMPSLQARSFAPLLTAKDETCIAWIFISLKGKNKKKKK